MLTRLGTFIGAVAVALSGCTLGGGCQDRVKSMVASSEQGDYPDSLRNDLLQLRDAALVLAERDRAQECADLANEMDDVLDDFEQRRETRRERIARLQYLTAAQPVTQIGEILKAQEIVGKPARNLNDQGLGVIENVALNPDNGRIAYVALTTGGFMGLGEKLIAVPWSDLSATTDGELFVVDLSLAALEKMRGFNAEQWPTGAIRQRRETPARGGSQDR